jgi:hypothetical protein
LFYEIDLETDDELGLCIVFPSNGYHSEKVHKGLTASSVVDQTDLCLCLLMNSLFQIGDGLIVNISTPHARLNFTIRRLEETAIPAENHMFRIPSKSFKVLGTVYNGRVCVLCITHYKGA